MVGTDGDLYILEALMARRTNARLAGFTFLFYIAVGISVMVLSGKSDQRARAAKTSPRFR